MNRIVTVLLAMALLSSASYGEIGSTENGRIEKDLGLLTPIQNQQLDLKIPISADVIDIDSAVVHGAEYLRGMQADITEDNAGNGIDGVDESPDDPDDGGWDWVVYSPPSPFSHSVSPSPTNIYGITALGVYHAYLKNEDAGLFTTLLDAADAMVAGGTGSIRSASDLIYLMEFNDLSEVSGSVYMDAARAKYDARVAAYGSAQAFAQYIRDVRNGQGYGCGIIAWDIGAWVVVAAMLEDRYPGNGYGSDAVYIAEVIYQDSFNDNPGYFDIIDDQGWDPTYSDENYFWYTLGITGLIDAFVAADVHTSELPGLLAILNDCRYPSGAYSFSYGANEFDEDWQSAAYSVLTLARYNQVSYQDDINLSAFWIASTQDQSGGFLYSDNSHYPEIGGECTSAMSYGSNPAEVWVDDDYCDVCANDGHNWGYDAFDTVQDGVNVAGVELVHIAAGYYEEQVVIKNDMTISGAGKDVTIIQSPVSLTEYFTTSSNNYPIVYIHDTDNVEIEGLTIDGLGRGNVNYRFTGIGIWNAGATLTDIRLTGVRDTPFSGTQHGVSIYSFNNTGGPYNIDVSGVDIDDMQKTAIALGGAGLTTNVSGCVITGNGPTGVTAQNGIQVNDGATGTISGNDISGIFYTGSSWSASGILALYTGNDLVISQNTVHDCQGALNAYFCDDMQVTENTFTNNDFEFVWGGDGVVVGGNEFTDNSQALYIADATNMTVSENAFSGNDYAVIIDGLAAGIGLTANDFTGSGTGAILVIPYLTDEPNDVNINFNNIAGNAFGVGNSTANMVDATGNWWGDISGPAYGVSPLNFNSPERPKAPSVDSENIRHELAPVRSPAKIAGMKSLNGDMIALEGSGDQVSTVVDYSPWWGANYVGDPHASAWNWHVDNSNSSGIQEAVDMALAGDYIYANPGNFEEQVVITKNDLTIIGSGSGIDPNDNTIVIAPNSMPYYFTTSANNYPVIGLDGVTGVSIQSLAVDGAGRGNTNYRFVGVGFWNAGGNMSDCYVLNIENTPFSGSQHGVALYSYNNTGGPYSINVSNTLIETFQKTGMALSGEGLTVDINNCIVRGAGYTPITAQNGIQVAYGAGGTISDCVVSDIGYDGSGWTASGFLFYNGGTVDLTDITVNNTQSCIVYQETQGTLENVVVNPGEMVSSEGLSVRDYGIMLGDGKKNSKVRSISILKEDQSSDEDAMLVEPTVVTVNNSQFIGIDFAASIGIAGWALGGDVSVTVTECDVHNWETGLVAYEDGGAALVTAARNAIYSNFDGYWSNAAGTQDARCNWWGDITGPVNPTSNPDAIGNSASDLVDYSPWWSRNYMGDPHVDKWNWMINTSNTSSIQEGIDMAASGDSVCATEDVYTGTTHIDKPITLIGEVGSRVEVGNPDWVGLDISSGDVTVDNMRFLECKIGIMIYLDQSDYSVSHGYQNIKLANNTIWNTHGSRGFGIYVGTESERYNPADPIGIYDPSLTSLLDFTGLQITGNSIFHTEQAALVLQSITATTGTINVSGNTFFEIPSYSGLWIDAGQNILVDGNDFSECGYAVFLSDYGDGYYEGSPNDTYDPKYITFSNNVITLGNYGFAVYDGWLSELTFYHNSITGHTNRGFYNYLPFDIDATLNYWGSLDGPTHPTNPAGDGDVVSNYVEYDPWCNEDFTICNFHVGANCHYVIGDWDGSGTMNIADIVDSFSNLKIGSPGPSYECECPAGSGNLWAVAMDVNETCTFNIADVVAAFSKLKTGLPDLLPCPDCPPISRIIPGSGGEKISVALPEIIAGGKMIGNVD